MAITRYYDYQCNEFSRLSTKWFYT